MKKIRNLVIGGIQQKIFNLVLVTVVLMIVAYTSVTVYQYVSLNRLVEETNSSQQETISAISSQTMRNVVDKSLGESNLLEAYIANDVFKELKNETIMLAELVEGIYDNAQNYQAYPVERPQLSEDGVPAVQLVTDAGVDLSDPDISYHLGLLGNASRTMVSMYDNYNINSCFIGTPDGLFIITDDRQSVKFDEEGDLLDFPVTDRPWYTGAVASKGLYFTDVEKDAFTDQIGIVCSCPVYYEGNLVAVVGIDLFLDSMKEAIESAAEDGRILAVINQDGHAVFSTETEGEFQVKAIGAASDLRESENSELGSFVTDALQSATDIRLVNLDGKNWYMAGAPMESVGWALVSAVDAELLDQPSVLMNESLNTTLEGAEETFDKGLKNSRSTIIVLVCIIFVLGSAFSLYVAKRIVGPLNKMTGRIASLGGEDLQFKMEDEYRTDDEIQILAESFADLSRKTLQYVKEVKRITGEKERISTELGMATAIQASQLPHLFPAFPDRKEFDIYASMTPAKEVGGDFYDFFLVDNDHIALVTADVSGKGVPAALFMMIARILIRNRMQAGEGPAKTLFTVNNQLLEGNEAELFVTVWLCVVEISTGKGIAANAGHEHPAIKRAGGGYELAVYKHSPAVATYENMEYTEHEFQLYPGDSIFSYTDGVPEATNAEETLFGTDRMLEALNSDPNAEPEKVLENVKNAIQNFVKDAEQFDDITMLALKYNGIT